MDQGQIGMHIRTGGHRNRNRKPSGSGSARQLGLAVGPLEVFLFARLIRGC